MELGDIYLTLSVMGKKFEEALLGGVATVSYNNYTRDWTGWAHP
jgi:hypothetical protein